METSEFDLLIKLDYKANRILNEEEQSILHRLKKEGTIKSCTAVPSPALINLLDKRVYFVIISANNSADFNRIRKKLVSDWSDRISSYTLIGEADFLCRVCGTDYLVSLIRDEFDDLSQEISVYRVEDTLLSWGTVVPEHAKRMFDGNLPEQIKLISELQKNCRTNTILEEVKETLLENGLVIKYSILKDYEKTRTLKAFVIISLPVRRTNIERFEEYLLSPEVTGIFEESISIKKFPVTTGIYKVTGELGNYLLEVQFESVYDYHEWMDRIYQKLKNLDSRTFLVDSCISEMMDSVERIEYEPVVGKEYEFLGQAFRESVAQVSIALSESQKLKFRQMNEKRQRQIISIYEKLNDLYHQVNFTDKSLDKEKIEIAIKNLLQAMVEESKAQYLTIMGPVGTVLENYLNNFTLQEVQKKFSSFSEAQQSLGMPTSNFGQFTLNSILHLLRNWNKKYPDNLIVSPDTIIRLEKINDIRNYSSHGGSDIEPLERRPYALTWKDTPRLEEDLVDGFYDTLYILGGLNAGVLKSEFGLPELFRHVTHIERQNEELLRHAREFQQPVLVRIVNVADEIKSKIVEVPDSSISDQTLIEMRDKIPQILERLEGIEQIKEEEKTNIKILKDSIDAMTKKDLKGQVLKTVEILASLTELTTGGPIIIKALAPLVHEGLRTILEALKGISK